MMSIDPRFRSLRRWEQAEPVPPPVLGNEDDDPRRLEMAGTVAAYNEALGEKHIFELGSTSEDLELLGMAFHSPHFTLPATSYHEWSRSADMGETYLYHRRVMSLLQSRRPPTRWLLKAPHRTFHLEVFVAAHPDARFVTTHRDPVKVVPSWVSIVASVLPPAEGERDLHRLGQEAAEHLRVSVDRMMASRARLSDARLRADFDTYVRRFDIELEV